jgi:tRNA-2-methylthio-N6-dimethylallyladenosine synthase
MKRPYKGEQFLSIVAALREKIPTISISTDIIVGFPGESEEDFEATCTIFDEIKFDMAFIFKYSIRPGTVAEQLGNQISQEIREARNQILLKKWNNILNNTMNPWLEQGRKFWSNAELSADSGNSKGIRWSIEK